MLTDAPVSFGVIPHDHWFQPDWIDEQRAQEGRDRLVWQNIIYGGQFTLPCYISRGVINTDIFRQCVVSVDTMSTSHESLIQSQAIVICVVSTLV